MHGQSRLLIHMAVKYNMQILMQNIRTAVVAGSDYSEIERDNSSNRC